MDIPMRPAPWSLSTTAPTWRTCRKHISHSAYLSGVLDITAGRSKSHASICPEDGGSGCFEACNCLPVYMMSYCSRLLSWRIFVCLQSLFPSANRPMRARLPYHTAMCAVFWTDCIPVAAHVVPQPWLEAAHETLTRAAPDVGVFSRYTSLYFRVTCQYKVSEWVKLKLQIMT
jgi:hypothetical protein